jgi:hypothetical protein
MKTMHGRICYNVAVPYRRVPFVLTLLAAFAACRKESIQVYRVPKEGAPSISAAAPEIPAEAPAEAAESGLSWSVPAGWRSQPATQMRRASFLAGAGADAPDVSVVVFPGDAGGLLPNINRWRGQLGLEPVEEASLASTASALSTKAGKLTMVDLSGQGGRRTLGAVIQSGGKSWFFKMTGDSTAVERSKPAYLAFLRSLR